jgi:hypothetical protein
MASRAVIATPGTPICRSEIKKRLNPKFSWTNSRRTMTDYRKLAVSERAGLL